MDTVPNASFLPEAASAVAQISCCVSVTHPETKERENYANLKAQSSFVLAEKVNKHRMAIQLDAGLHSEVPGIGVEVWKDMLIEELEQIKSKPGLADTKLRLISKEDVRQELYNSGDAYNTGDSLLDSGH